MCAYDLSLVTETRDVAFLTWKTTLKNILLTVKDDWRKVMLTVTGRWKQKGIRGK